MDLEQSLTCKIEPLRGMNGRCIESINPRQTVCIDDLAIGIHSTVVCLKDLTQLFPPVWTSKKELERIGLLPYPRPILDGHAWIAGEDVTDNGLLLGDRLSIGAEGVLHLRF